MSSCKRWLASGPSAIAPQWLRKCCWQETVSELQTFYLILPLSLSLPLLLLLLPPPMAHSILLPLRYGLHESMTPTVPTLCSTVAVTTLINNNKCPTAARNEARFRKPTFQGTARPALTCLFAHAEMCTNKGQRRAVHSQTKAKLTNASLHLLA